jgi:predicted molibdopterin-dependent oxidoreductase YjgC
MAGEERIALSVDGRQIETTAGTRLLDVLREAGVRVPTLCHDERLTPYGGCRLCVVARRDGRGGLVPACSTPALPGMVIETASPDVVDARRQQLLLLSLNHRLECPGCERHGDCRFQDLLYEYGVPALALPFERMRYARDESSPVIVRDPEKCILCGKCVRLCDEVQGVAAIALVHRGLNARVATLLDRGLDCEFCGQCVNACPVAALTAKPHASEVPAWMRSAETTTCGFCSCGCQLEIETHDRRLIRVASSDAVEPNRGKLCVKGWLGADLLASGDRLLRPLVRRDGQLVEASWPEALAEAARAIASATAARERVLAIGSARLTCEAAYLMQRLFRTAGRTAEIRPGPAAGAAALSEGLAALTDLPRSTATFDDLRAADVVLVLRADPTRTHPLVKTELVQGVRQRGQKLVLAHALSGGLERHASMFVPVTPGGEETLINALSARLLRRSPEAAAALGGVPGFEAWTSSLDAYLPAAIAAAAGIENDTLDRLCALLLGARRSVTVVVTGLGIPGDEAAITRAAVALDALLGPRGGGVLVLGEKANLQGALDTGLHPAWLPGGRRVADAGWRAHLSRVWNCDVMPPMDAGGDRRVPALAYVAAQDPFGAWPGGTAALDDVGRARTLIVQDAFLTETARSAHIVLPVALLLERQGSTVGADGVRRTLHRALPPPAALPDDAEVFVALAAALGTIVPDGDALAAEMNEVVGWPLAQPVLRRLVPARAPAPAAARGGMLLDASPQLFRSGSVTERSMVLQALAPSVALRLSPSDAAAHGVRNGEPVRLTADGCEALLRARIDRTVRAGTVVVHGASRWENAPSRMIRDGEAVAVEIRRS